MTDELRKLAEAATPGPWRHSKDHGQVGDVVLVYDDYISLANCQSIIGQPWQQRDANAAFIAAVHPQTVLRLLEVVEKAEEVMQHMLIIQEIARRWEPDNSSGQERRWLVLARDAQKSLIAALAALREGEQ